MLDFQNGISLCLFFFFTSASVLHRKKAFDIQPLAKCLICISYQAGVTILDCTCILLVADISLPFFWMEGAY